MKSIALDRVRASSPPGINMEDDLFAEAVDQLLELDELDGK